MGLFSFFAAPDEDAEGSYCDTFTRSHLDYLDDEEIDEQIVNAESRGDSVEYGDEDFDSSAIQNRHDEDGRQARHGPKEPWWRL